jgi:hypothetical protein
MRTLKYGGDLYIGDFIGISVNNCMDFGWYCGDGTSGTLQYYTIWAPKVRYEDYKAWEKLTDEQKKKWYPRAYKNGFTTKCLYKSYINAVHDTRVMKLSHPENIFTSKADREAYEKSKEVLIKLNFIK